MNKIVMAGVGRQSLRRARNCMGTTVDAAAFLSTLTREEAAHQAQELATAKRMKIKSLDSNNNKQHHHNYSMETMLAHAGVVTTDKRNAGMSPPLDLATTFTRALDGIYLPTDSVYGRCDNPTRLLFEKEVALLECQDDEVLLQYGSNVSSCAFSSGMMAASGIILAHKTPLHVILPKDLYHGVPTVLKDVFERFGGVTVHRVDATSLESVEQGIRKVLSIDDDRNNAVADIILWMETPSNPLCHVIDIAAVCSLVKEISASPTTKRSITTVVDSTLAPPTIQRPLSLGADIVMHSATKYIGGHSDLTAGVVTANPSTERGRDLAVALRQVLVAVGGVASPMDSWLALRGLRTLSLRVQRQCDTALQVATFLQQQQQQQQQQQKGSVVSAVHYPGLESHPQHYIAKKQMQNGNFGGVLSFEMTSETHAFALTGALQVVQRATSLGGTESLIEHRASIEPPGRVVSPPGLLRLSVGLESPHDLIHDLSMAIDIAKEVHEGK